MIYILDGMVGALFGSSMQKGVEIRHLYPGMNWKCVVLVSDQSNKQLEGRIDNEPLMKFVKSIYVICGLIQKLANSIEENFVGVDATNRENRLPKFGNV